MDTTPHLLEQILIELRLLNGKTSPVREILSIPQAAEYLGQSEHTIREWVRRRKIPHYKVNGAVKFRKSRLDKWINTNEIAVI